MYPDYSYAPSLLGLALDEAGGSRMETTLIAALLCVFCALVVLAVRRAT
jgi:hypothetical protein